MRDRWFEVFLGFVVANFMWAGLGQTFDQQLGMWAGISYFTGYIAHMLVEWKRKRDKQ